MTGRSPSLRSAGCTTWPPCNCGPLVPWACPTRSPTGSKDRPKRRSWPTRFGWPSCSTPGRMPNARRLRRRAVSVAHERVVDGQVLAGLDVAHRAVPPGGVSGAGAASGSGRTSNVTRSVVTPSSSWWWSCRPIPRRRWDASTANSMMANVRPGHSSAMSPSGERAPSHHLVPAASSWPNVNPTGSPSSVATTSRKPSAATRPGSDPAKSSTSAGPSL